MKRISKKLWDVLAAEFGKVGFAWRPTVIVACTAFTLVFREYHSSGWYWEVVKWVGGRELVEVFRAAGLYDVILVRLLLPIAVLLLMRERLRDYGLGAGMLKRGLIICGVFYAAYIPCYAALLANNAFREYYAATMGSFPGWPQFFVRAAVATLPVMVAGEFLFRGFLLFGLKRAFGAYAGVLGQLIPYVMVHFGKPELETWGSFPVGLALAYLAVRTNSIWYGTLLHWSIAVLLNVGVVIAHT